MVRRKLVITSYIHKYYCTYRWLNKKKTRGSIKMIYSLSASRARGRLPEFLGTDLRASCAVACRVMLACIRRLSSYIISLLCLLRIIYVHFVSVYDFNYFIAVLFIFPCNYNSLSITIYYYRTSLYC